MKSRYASALAVAAVLCACAGPVIQRPIPQNAGVSFDATDIAWSREKGPNTIEGSAVLRTQGGEARTCAGGAADLTPYSEYAAARMRIIYGSTERGYFSTLQEIMDGPRVADDQYTPAYMALRRHANCDALGNFSFSDLPDGTYFVTVRVVWYAGRSSQGG